MKVLVVEDNQDTARVVLDALKFELWDASHAANIEEARQIFARDKFDLLVLDWELPDGTGIQFCTEVRDQGALCHVLFLTGRSSVDDRVTGLDSGGDDYLVKPFQPPELIARAKALIRRPVQLQMRPISVRNIELDKGSRTVRRDGEEVIFHEREYPLLELFMTNPTRVMSYDEIIERAWPTETDISQESIRVAILRVRRKLEKEGDKPLIVAIRGFGYRLDP